MGDLKNLNRIFTQLISDDNTTDFSLVSRRYTIHFLDMETVGKIRIVNDDVLRYKPEKKANGTTPTPPHPKPMATIRILYNTTAKAMLKLPQDAY